MSLLSPQIEFDNQLDQTRFLLIWRISVVFSFFFTLLAAVFYFYSKNTFVAYSIAVAICYFSVVYLWTRRKYKLIYFLVSIGGCVVISTSMIVILDAPHFVDFLWLLIGVLVAFFGLGQKWGIGIMVLNIFPISYFLIFKLNEHISMLPQQTIEERIFLAIEVIVCLILISYVIYLFVQISKSAQNELIKKNEVLRERADIIEKSNNEKTVLVKEIHHRVKNNLQIIISLLRLQMTEIKNADTKVHFTEAINRVMVMSSIHQKLYKEQDISAFSLVSYLEDLSSELKQFFLEDFPINISIESDYKVIDLKTVVPVGLIMNELLSNTFKYAFRASDSGEISILIRDQEDEFELIYFDNGDWREPASESSSFGLDLINTLTEQLNGTVEFKTNKDGTFYKFRLQKITE
jgi:two-component sensor histidine kinase